METPKVSASQVGAPDRVVRLCLSVNVLLDSGRYANPLILYDLSDPTSSDGALSAFLWDTMSAMTLGGSNKYGR